MPNPSTTQVVELREQKALADDTGGVNRDRIWALSLFSGRRGDTRGQRLECRPDLICVGESVNNRGLECPFPVVQLPDKVLEGFSGALDHRRRGRCPFPSELPGTCIFDLRLPISGS